MRLNQLHFLRMASTTLQSFTTHAIRALSIVAMVATASLLQACASTSSEVGSNPDATTGSATRDSRAAPEPELTLNLPSGDECVCQAQPPRDFTFLEKGFAALAGNEHREAITYFQRYQRIESSAEAQWEAAVAIAYSNMLPQSPSYDPGLASRLFAQIKSRGVDASAVHEKVLLMREALATLVTMQNEMIELQLDNAALAEALALREEALRRLRELTLGQKAATQ